MPTTEVAARYISNRSRFLVFVVRTYKCILGIELRITRQVLQSAFLFFPLLVVCPFALTFPFVRALVPFSSPAVREKAAGVD